MFSLCITNYERYDLLLESFSKVEHDARISEIIISDDHSSEPIYQALVEFALGKRKIKLFRNEQNEGMGHNKMLAIERASCEYCILFDSDNVLTAAYLDALQAAHRYPNVINMPDSGGYKLDYSRFAKWYISRNNINWFLTHPGADMMLNTCNYCVHRESYLDVYEKKPNVLAADTIWFNYLWLLRGYAFVVVPGMKYFHRVHAGSGFMQDLAKNNKMCAEILETIKHL